LNDTLTTTTTATTTTSITNHKSPTELTENQNQNQNNNANRSPSKRRISFLNKFQEEHFSKLTSGSLSKFSNKNPLETTINPNNNNSRNSEQQQPHHVTSESFTRAFNKLNSANNNNNNNNIKSSLNEFNSKRFSAVQSSPISFNKTSPMTINKNNLSNRFSSINANSRIPPQQQQQQQQRPNITNTNNNNLASSGSSSFQADFYTPTTTPMLTKKNNNNNTNIEDIEFNNFEDDSPVAVPQAQPLLKFEEIKPSTLKLRSLIPFNSNLPANKQENLSKTNNETSISFLNNNNNSKITQSESKTTTTTKPSVVVVEQLQIVNDLKFKSTKIYATPPPPLLSFNLENNNSATKLASSKLTNNKPKLYATASTNTDFIISKSSVSVGTECNLDDDDHDHDDHVIVGEDDDNNNNKQSKVFNDLENYLKYLLEPPKIEDDEEIKEITITNNNNNYDLYLKKNIIKFLLDSYTNITLKQDFTKISKNYFMNLTQILNSNEFNQEQVSYYNYKLYKYFFTSSSSSPFPFLLFLLLESALDIKTKLTFFVHSFFFLVIFYFCVYMCRTNQFS